MSEQPDDLPGAFEAAEALRRRLDAAKVLTHVLTGDSWGIQDVLLHHSSGPTAVHTFPLFWQAGHLLRTYLTDDERERVIGRLRQEIINAEVSRADDD